MSDMKNLYVISGVTGMTGNELARQILKDGHGVIGFDNFFASSIRTVEDLLENSAFQFHIDHNIHISVFIIERA